MIILISIVNTFVSIGVNIVSLRDWNRSLPYVDLIKQSRIWGSPSTPWDGNVTIDSITGWPTNDFGVIIATNDVDMGGKYLLYAEGNAQISTIDGLSIYITNQTYNKITNILTAYINVPQGQTGIILSFRNTTGPGLRNLSLLQTDYNLTSKSDLTKLILIHLSRFNLIRFMTWTDTNTNSDVNWNETTSIDWPQYTPPKHNPWETIPLIMKEFNQSMDLWINVPYNASDNYILHIAQLMFDQINETRHIYVEYSNELWNFGFEQTKSNFYAANDSVINHGDPLHLNYDNISNIHTWAYRRTAYQIKRISDLFKIIFGQNNVGPWKRIRPILAGEATNPHVIMKGLDYLNLIYGQPSSFLHGIALAPYFTLGKYSSWTNLTTDQVLNEFNSSIQRFLPEQGWNEQSSLGIHAVYAAWYKLSVYAYEGGSDTGRCLTCSLEAKINATRHPRMTDLCLRYLNGWYQFGFQTFNWYVSGAGSIELLGTWNLLEDMRQETLIDTTNMFNLTSPVAQLPRPSPKLKAIDLFRQSTIQLCFGISIPCFNFNATNYMNHSLSYPYSDLRNLTENSTFYYPLQTLYSLFIQINVTIYVAGNSGLLEVSLNNEQFIQIQTPQTMNTTIFEPTSPIQFNINQTIVPSIATLRLKNLQNGYSIRSFDIVLY